MPIRVNGKLLWDGGIYNNFPVDVAVDAFSPDVIIGSKAISNYSLPEEDDLMSHIQNMIVTKTDFTLPEDAILIEPEIPNYNVVDFSKAAETIERGYDATLNKMKAIKELITRQVFPLPGKPRRMLRAPNSSIPNSKYGIPRAESINPVLRPSFSSPYLLASQAKNPFNITSPSFGQSLTILTTSRF